MGCVRSWVTVSIFLALSVSVRAGELPTDSYFVESGGVVVGEAENFHARTFTLDETGWYIAPITAPDSEVLPSDGANPLLNARNGRYMQILPDDGGTAGGPANDPTIQYRINIATPGTYRLFLRWEANATGTGSGPDGIRGASDSLYANIREIASPTAGIADWYEFAQTVDGDFATSPWDGDGGFEQNTASPANTPAIWALTPGIYTLQFTEREDGAAIDAWVFQLDTLAAPTGDGPAESQVVPEPAGLMAVSLLGGLALLRRRKAGASA